MKAMLAIIVVGLLGISVYTVFYIRTVTHNPAEWHLDPRTALPSDTPNSYRLIKLDLTEFPVDLAAPTYTVNAATLSEAFDRFVMGQPRVERIAGSTEEAWITYVQRTEGLQFPDYISVQFYDYGDTGTSTIAIYSRSRFGHGDMGVNEARVKSWLRSISSFEQDPKEAEAAAAAAAAQE